MRNLVQLDSIDDVLRNSLWNSLNRFIWDRVLPRVPSSGTTFQNNPKLYKFCSKLWIYYYKHPIDTLDSWEKAIKYIRKDFFECEWFFIYDFLEFAAENYPFDDKEAFVYSCNQFLKTEMSAYRFVDGKITKLTTEREIAEIEEAIETGKSPVRTHLKSALGLLSDRKNPDYRNSIKESISAIESLTQDVLGEKGTFGELVKKLQSKIGLHPALGKAFSNLYGYTSDEDGIRHSIKDSDKVDFEDAKFFLVVCSAIVNFVYAKAKQ